MWQDVAGFMVEGTNSKELRGLVKEIYREYCYYFETDKDAPVIIDLGAHVGLASLYFKKLYPKAFVLAVEPVPELAQAFRQNMQANRITGVSLVEAAVVTPKVFSQAGGKVSMFADHERDKWWSTTRTEPDAWDGTKQLQEIQVPVTTLDQLIDYPVDLLKMDIEGAELEVLSASPQVLSQVKHVLLEYHPVGTNRLTELMQLLEKVGFKVSLYKNSKPVPLERARGLVMVEGRRG